MISFLILTSNDDNVSVDKKDLAEMQDILRQKVSLIKRVSRQAPSPPSCFPHVKYEDREARCQAIWFQANVTSTDYQMKCRNKKTAPLLTLLFMKLFSLFHSQRPFTYSFAGNIVAWPGEQPGATDRYGVACAVNHRHIGGTSVDGIHPGYPVRIPPANHP
jgi:hypothetical protein